MSQLDENQLVKCQKSTLAREGLSRFFRAPYRRYAPIVMPAADPHITPICDCLALRPKVENCLFLSKTFGKFVQILLKAAILFIYMSMRMRDI